MNLLSPTDAVVSAKFVLLSSDGPNMGSFTKTNWGPKAVEALLKFIEAMEEDALVQLFDDESNSEPTQAPSNLSFPQLPVLGGTKRSDTP